jgi:hypothetical protein
MRLIGEPSRLQLKSEVPPGEIEGNTIRADRSLGEYNPQTAVASTQKTA